MRKTTLLDAYREMGDAGNLLLMMFLAILVYGGVIYFRKFGYCWRKSFLLMAGVQAATGAACCFYFLWGVFYRFAHNSNESVEVEVSPLLASVSEILRIVPFACWLTIILLVFSAVLFITGKKVESNGGGHAAVPSEKQPDGSAIRHL